MSSKREDADRKIGIRIQQEMVVLPPFETVFVIISSDQDFRHYYQLLSCAGYEVIVIHNAAHDSSNVKTLAMHASKVHTWSDIMSNQNISISQPAGQMQNPSDVTSNIHDSHRTAYTNCSAADNTGTELSEQSHGGVNQTPHRSNRDVSSEGTYGQRSSRARVAIAAPRYAY